MHTSRSLTSPSSPNLYPGSPTCRVMVCAQSIITGYDSGFLQRRTVSVRARHVEASAEKWVSDMKGFSSM
eukprot:2199330-Rhodomonas_salina.5